MSQKCHDRTSPAIRPLPVLAPVETYRRVIHGPAIGCIRRPEISAMATTGHDRIERRLAAILAADVAGYSRLTGVDEEGTHVQLQGHLRALIDPKVAEHRGRVVKNTGDGMLAELAA